MSLLKVENLTGGYTKKPVLNDVSFTIEEKQMIGLIGLNGAGKSTTIKHIIGLMEPKKGNIQINDRNLQKIQMNIGSNLPIYLSHQYCMTN